MIFKSQFSKVLICWVYKKEIIKTRQYLLLNKTVQFKNHIQNFRVSSAYDIIFTFGPWCKI